jgi:hypothetical protein
MSRAAAFVLYPTAVALLAMQPEVIAAQAAPNSAAPQQQQAAAPEKQDPMKKVTCRIRMEGNMPRRICMTNQQWQQADQGRVDATSETYIDRFNRCGLRDTGTTSGALGAC